MNGENIVVHYTHQTGKHYVGCNKINNKNNSKLNQKWKGSEMKNAIRILAVLTFVITLSQTVFAGESSTNKNWHTRFGIGYTEQIDNYDEVNVGQTEWEFDGGPNFNVSAGYDANFWAVEVEASYKKMDMDSRISKLTGTRLNFEGDQDQIAFMLNGFWYPKPDWTVSPYLGAGLGVTKISWNDIRVSGSSTVLDDSDIVFTYQLIIGASYEVSPQLFLEIDYRYFAPDDAEILSSTGTTGKLDNQELNIFGLGVKYKF